MPYYSKFKGGKQNNMAKYKKRKDGRYRSSVTINNKTVYVYGHTISEVDQKKAELLAENRMGKNIFTKEIVFEKYAAKWLEQKKQHVEHRTHKGYADILRLYTNDIDYIPIQDITKSTLQNLINKYYDKPRTCRLIKATLNQVFESACDDGLIYRNPISNIVLPKYEPNKKRPLSDTENLLTEVTEFTDRELAFILIMKWCGLRPEECLALSKHCFNLTNYTVDIKFALEFIKNKPHIKSTKTANSKRRIPLIGPLRTFIPYYISNLSNDYLFTSITNGELITESSYKKMWKSIKNKMNKKAAELNLLDNADNLTPYIFRHNFATLLNDLNVSDREIQYLMGHTSIQTANKWYIHLNPDELDAISLLENYSKGQKRVKKFLTS